MSQEQTPGEQGLFQGLLAGYQDWKHKDYDSNLQKGQRSKEAQDRWKEYSFMKARAQELLSEGLITEKQFNHLKGKAGAHYVTDYYVDREKNPVVHHIANNVANMFYQGDQSMFGNQPWSEALKDYWQQDEGVEDMSPLLDWKREKKGMLSGNYK